MIMIIIHIIHMYTYIYTSIQYSGILAIFSPPIDGCIRTCSTGGTHPLGVWRTAKQPHVLMLRLGNWPIWTRMQRIFSISTSVGLVRPPG